MERNLGVGEDEVGYPCLVDQGEFASDPPTRVIADESVRTNAKLLQHSVEHPGLPLRRIVVLGAAVRLPESDQVRCVAGKAILKEQDDLMPGLSRQGKSVQEDGRRPAPRPAPVNRRLSDSAVSFHQSESARILMSAEIPRRGRAGKEAPPVASTTSSPRLDLVQGGKKL